MCTLDLLEYRAVVVVEWEGAVYRPVSQHCPAAFGQYHLLSPEPVFVKGKEGNLPIVTEEHQIFYSAVHAAEER